MFSKKEILRLYGKDAIISRKDRFLLVHLDRPTAAVVRNRTRSFTPSQFFHDDCPICQMQRESGVFVFDQPYDIEEIDDFRIDEG